MGLIRETVQSRIDPGRFDQAELFFGPWAAEEACGTPVATATWASRSSAGYCPGVTLDSIAVIARSALFSLGSDPSVSNGSFVCAPGMPLLRSILCAIGAPSKWSSAPVVGRRLLNRQTDLEPFKFQLSRCAPAAGRKG